MGHSEHSQWAEGGYCRSVGNLRVQVRRKSDFPRGEEGLARKKRVEGREGWGGETPIQTAGGGDFYLDN